MILVPFSLNCAIDGQLETDFCWVIDEELEQAIWVYGLSIVIDLVLRVEADDSCTKSKVFLVGSDKHLARVIRVLRSNVCGI